MKRTIFEILDELKSHPDYIHSEVFTIHDIDDLDLLCDMDVDITPEMRKQAENLYKQHMVRFFDYVWDKIDSIPSFYVENGEIKISNN